MSFLGELRRRKVVRVAVVYAVVAWLLVQIIVSVEEPLNLPGWMDTFVIVVVVIGFPLALVLAWAFEITPDGVVRTQVGPDGSMGLNGVPKPEDDSARITEGPLSESPIDPRKSIVVLPFDNISPDSSDAYFSDGLTEEIITHLSQIRSLRVISRSSAMVLKGTNKDIRSIGTELDVQYVLEGSVRKAGNDLRITAQLIDAVTDAHLWAERYEGVLDDVFRIQEEASQAIVRALDLRINPGEQERLFDRPIDDIRAYECYLKARADIHKGTASSLDDALHHLQTGLSILGESVPLHQGVAELHLQRYEYGQADEDTLPEAERALEKVDALASGSATSEYLRGRIERFRGSVVTAVTHFEKALDLDPSHSGALLFLVAAYSLQLGKPQAAAPYAQRLSEIDPLSPLAVFVLGCRHVFLEQFEEALAEFRRAVEVAPDFVWAPLMGDAYVHLWQGHTEEAIEVLAPIERRTPRDAFAEWATLLRQAASQDTPVDADVLSESTVDYLWNDPEAPWYVASAFALGGNTEEAFRWLDQAVARGWVNYPLLSEGDPLLAGVRDDRRFSQLASRVRDQWTAAIGKS